MKSITLLLALFFGFSFSVLSQGLVSGMMVVNGTPFISQQISDLITEAGENDNSEIFSFSNAHEVSMYVDPAGLIIPGTVEEACSSNVFKYTLYANVENAPTGVEISAKTEVNGGQRYPLNSPYDVLPNKPLGERDLTAENAGQYIVLPSDPNSAIKIAEFVGCRENIPIQYRVKASLLSPAEISSLNIKFSVVGSVN